MRRRRAHVAVTFALAAGLTACDARRPPAGSDGDATARRIESAAPSPSAAPVASATSSTGLASSTSAASSALPAASATSAAASNGACPEGMARVDGGKLETLEHGHDVTVGPFCLDVVEVTVARFRAAVLAGEVERGCHAKPDCPAVPKHTAWDGDGSAALLGPEDAKVSRFCNGQRSDVDDHPVNCVSFGEAEAFCRSRRTRLPRGDEWEWAAHGTRPTPWGSPIATDEPCWGKPHKRVGTCPVRSQPKDRTPEGIFDLGGDVSEWVTPPARAGKSPARWAYGASWYAIDDGYARAALGGMEMPARRAETVGFRCAADAP